MKGKGAIDCAYNSSDFKQIIDIDLEGVVALFYGCNETWIAVLVEAFHNL